MKNVMSKLNILYNTKTKKTYLAVALFTVILLMLPNFVDSNYVLFLMLQVFINIIVSLGLNIIAGMTGQNHSATGAIYSIGAYVSAILTTKLGFSPWIGLILSLLAGAFIGIVIGYPSLKLNSTFLWLVTSAFCEVVTLLERNLVDLTGGTQGIKKIPFFSVFGKTLKKSSQIYYLYLIIMLVILAITIRIVDSRYGRTLRAIRDNEESMRSNGINDTSKKILAFTISSIYCALAGTMYAHCYNYITPVSFQAISTNYLIMIMIGGFGTIPGSIIGAVLITLLPEQLRFIQNYNTLVFSTITLLVALFMPKGIISLLDFKSDDNIFIKISNAQKEKKAVRKVENNG